MIFKASKAHDPKEPLRMGFRSPLVLAKLGFDLRASYAELLEEPLSDEISRPLWALAAREDQVN
jgi:hypothetical protein